MNIAALIVAAGKGERMGDGTALPKQYQPVAGKALIAHSVERLSAHPAVHQCVCVIHPDHEAQYQTAFLDSNAPQHVEGGATRQLSVLHGLRALEQQGASHVLIHDAARPMLSDDLITRLCEALVYHEAVVPCVPVADSLKRVEKEQLVESVQRDHLMQVQTPQAFELKSILMLHEAAAAHDDVYYTDDASLCEHADQPVAVVAGERRNIKVTFPEDVALVEAMMKGAV